MAKTPKQPKPTANDNLKNSIGYQGVRYEQQGDVSRAMMNAGPGRNRLAAGLSAAWNNRVGSPFGQDGPTTIGAQALRLFGKQNAAMWYDRFLAYDTPRSKAKREAANRKRRGLGEESPDSSGSSGSSRSGRSSGGVDPTVRKVLRLQSALLITVSRDVKDIKSLLMPKGVVAKDKSGQTKFVQFNPLAPQGEQFNVVTESGKLTAMPPGKGFQVSAQKKAALATAQLALKILEEDKKKSKLKQTFSDPKERNTFAKDPLAALLESQKKIQEDVAEIKENTDDKKGLLGKMGEFLKDWWQFSPFLGFFKILAKLGFVGLAAALGIELGRIIYEKFGTQILDAVFWIKDKWAQLSDWFNNFSLEEFFLPLTAAIRKVTDFLRITKSDEQYKAEEKKNAAAGRTRGGIASSKGPSQDQAIELYDKKAKDSSLSPKERAENARVRDTLINQKMQRAAGAPMTATPGHTDIQPTQGPSSRGRKVAPTGSMRNQEPTPAATATASQATGGKEAVMRAMDEAGIKDQHRASLLAQIDHESGGFKRMEENLNYSAKGLLKTFGKYYKTEEQAQADARNPQAIANRVYGGRMGNSADGDGYRYRGRGFIQLTGKDNYRQFGKLIGVDLLKNPDLAANPAIAAKIAVAYYKQRVVDRGIAADDVKGVTKAINGGTIGLDDRADKYASYSKEGTTLMAGGPTPAKGLSAASVDGESRSLSAAKEQPVQVAMVSPTTVNQTTNNTTKTPPRPLPKASAVSKDDSFVRTASRDTVHPVYA